jgi:hypothetical protein
MSDRICLSESENLLVESLFQWTVWFLGYEMMLGL